MVAFAANSATTNWWRALRTPCPGNSVYLCCYSRGNRWGNQNRWIISQWIAVTWPSTLYIALDNHLNKTSSITHRLLQYVVLTTPSAETRCSYIDQFDHSDQGYLHKHKHNVFKIFIRVQWKIQHKNLWWKKNKTIHHLSVEKI